MRSARAPNATLQQAVFDAPFSGLILAIAKSSPVAVAAHPATRILPSRARDWHKRSSGPARLKPIETGR
jgi:hypothetical protein